MSLETLVIDKQSIPTKRFLSKGIIGETGLRLRELLTSNPGQFNRTQLGAMVGVTRERARQLVNQLGLVSYLRDRTIRCPICGKPKRNRVICRECYKKQNRMRVWCDNCRALIDKKASLLKRNKLHFCNRKCWSTYMGKHFGFGVHGTNKQNRSFITPIIKIIPVNQIPIRRRGHGHRKCS